MNEGASNNLTKEQKADIEALAALPEEEIDTSDIPEILDWSGAKRGLLYRPVKKQITLRLDADVVAWFRANAPNGRGYQTEMNRVLREHATRASKRA
ncbi:MAG: BrnA antitoxin family protein [Nitrospinae bacterium]|nr:BrnA antitoxin family protein [Nitrospinota bacterium]